MDSLESARAKILPDLNLAVRYGIVMRIYAYKKYWRILNLTVVGANRKSAKFSGHTVLHITGESPLKN